MWHLLVIVLVFGVFMRRAFLCLLFTFTKKNKKLRVFMILELFRILPGKINKKIYLFWCPKYTPWPNTINS